MKKTLFGTLAAMLLGALFAFGFVGVWQIHKAAAEPKVETHLTELDAEKLRRILAELDKLSLMATPLQREGQAVLDKYKLRLEEMGKSWGIADWGTREIQRRAAPTIAPPKAAEGAKPVEKK